MAKTEVNPAQIQLAAAAGVKLLQQDDLPVPVSIAKTGALNVLEGLLNALANGEVVLANPTPAENIGGDPANPPMAPVESPPDAPPANDGNGSAEAGGE